MSSCILRCIYLNEFNYVEMIFQFWGLYFAVTKKPFLLEDILENIITSLSLKHAWHLFI